MRLILVAATLAGALIAAPFALAAAPAGDEYTLEFPGVGDASSRGGGLTGSPTDSMPGVQAGVAGENEADRTPLESAIATIAGAPVLILLALLTTIWLLLNGPGRRSPGLG